MSASTLVVIPTRSRPQQAQRCVDSVRATADDADVLLIIDQDGIGLYEEVEAPKLLSPGRGLPTALNSIVPDIVGNYELVMFLGDDVICHTPHWDTMLAEPIRARGYGWSYGNDMLQYDRLPTHWMTSTNIILALGWMVPAGFKHLYVDNVVQALGNAMGALDYIKDACLEHCHYVNAKAPMDETYAIANADETYAHDELAFKTYCRDHLASDLQRIQDALGL